MNAFCGLSHLPLAVVPSLLGPLQTLMLALPQVLLGLVLAARALVNPSAWRSGASRLADAIRDRPLKCGGHALLVAAAPCLLWWGLRPVAPATSAQATEVGRGDWAMFRADAARTGASDSNEPVTNPRLIWKFREASLLERRPFASSPAVAGGRVLIGGDFQKLYCLDLRDGSAAWVFDAQASVFSSPAVWNGRVYVGEGLHENRNCNIYCLDVGSGRVLWSFRTASHTESSPAVHEGKVYFGAGSDGAYCCDALDGRKIWHQPAGHVDCAPLVIGDRVYYGSGYDWTGIFCVDAGDGRIVWKHELPAASWGAPSHFEGRLYVAVGNGSFSRSADEPVGEVRCLDASSGRELWRFAEPRDGVLTSVVVASGRAVFGSRDGGCYALDAATGTLLWRAEVGSPILSSPAVVGDRVFFGADDGLFRCLSLEDGSPVWSYDTSEDMIDPGQDDGQIQSSPAVAGDRIVFGASNGNVYCLGPDPKTGPIIAQTRFKSPLMRAADSAVGQSLTFLAGATGSYGVALVLVALLLKLLMFPLDWQQARQISMTRAAAPVIERMRRQYSDYRVHRYEVRALLARHGVRPMTTLCCVLIQVPVFILAFTVLFATSVLAGKSFLWIRDLSLPDRLDRVPLPAGLGGHLKLLPLALMASVWFFLRDLRAPGRRAGAVRHVGWIVASVALGLLAYRWPAALLIFTLALLWSGLALQKALLWRAGHRQAKGGDA